MNARDSAPLTRILVLTIVIAVGTAGIAVAQSTVSVRGNVGASFFRSPDSESVLLNSGTNLGLEAEIRVYRGFGITVGGGYDSFTLNENNARIYSQTGGDVSFLGGSIGLQYTFINSTDAHPFVGLGVGLYQLRVTDRIEITDSGDLVSIDDPVTAVHEGVHISTGSYFRLNDTYSVFAEPRYMVFNVGEGLSRSLRYLTFRLGLDVQF